jgi:hypothetical protein
MILSGLSEWCVECTDPILRCFVNPGGAELRGLPSWHGPQAHKLANGLRMSTKAPSQDLSAAWVTIQG